MYFYAIDLCVSNFMHCMFRKDRGVKITLSHWKHSYKVPIVIEGMCFCSGAVFRPPEKEHSWHIHLQAIPTAEWRSETVPEKVVSQSPGSHSAAGRTQLSESPMVKQIWCHPWWKNHQMCWESLCSRKKTTWKVSSNLKKKKIWYGLFVRTVQDSPLCGGVEPPPLNHLEGVNPFGLGCHCCCYSDTAASCHYVMQLPGDPETKLWTFDALCSSCMWCFVFQLKDGMWCTLMLCVPGGGCPSCHETVHDAQAEMGEGTASSPEGEKSSRQKTEESCFKKSADCWGILRDCLHLFLTEWVMQLFCMQFECN